MSERSRWHRVSAGSRRFAQARVVWFAVAVAAVAGPAWAHGSTSSRNAEAVVSPVEIVGSREVAASRGQANHVLLVSTRRLGTQCDPATMAERLHCERLEQAGAGGGRWQSFAWSDMAREFAEPMPTVVYIHGNRIASGEDRTHGLAVFHRLAVRKGDRGPIRYVIWSWPSEQIRGPVKDYKVKAARTKPAAWQLAWAIDQWPAEASISLVGYSYGARVATGALHLLGGGELNGLALDERSHAARRPLRAALVAAALDADWLRAGGYHGRALDQVDQLLLVNNQLDPAMRFYHLAMKDRNARALGYSGPIGRSSLGELASRIQMVDVTSAVGRSHALDDYLAATGSVGRVLDQVVALPADGENAVANASLAGKEGADERQ